MATEKNPNLMAIVMDFETGGLDCQKCAATQISMHAISLSTFEQTGSLNLYIKPYQYQENAVKPKKKVLRSKYDIEDTESQVKMMEYDDEALTVSGITMNMLDYQGMELKEACERIIEFLKDVKGEARMTNKPILAGQNILFDIGFLQQILTYTGMYKKFATLVGGSTDFFGNFQPYYIDTLLLAKLAFCNDKQKVSYKLESLAEYMGIEMDDAHDADADVTGTQELLRSFTQRLRNNSQENDKDTLAVVKKEKIRNHFKI